jgi:hypothetical protein
MKGVSFISRWKKEYQERKKHRPDKLYQLKLYLVQIAMGVTRRVLRYKNNFYLFQTKGW